MANANAIVEKMAAVGLRHGEKAGVAVAMTVFLVCVGAAVSQKTIETTPEQVKKAAEASTSNLNRKEERNAIIKKLVDTDKIEPTDFANKVEEQIKVKLVADVYKPQRTWVTPEPGAGLMRDKPDLIAPTDLYAYPGRGGLLVYALDEDGERIKLQEGEEKEEKKQRYGNTSKRKKGGARGGSMMGGRQRKKKSKSKVEIAREEKEERERKERQLKGLLTGGDAGSDLSEPKAEVAKEEGGPYKEVTKGYRWVAITGILDHGQLLANYRAALKNPAIAHPQYMRLELERRNLQDDGTWSAWAKVDEDTNLGILDNIPYSEEELAPEKVRPDLLVDPLPFLTAGLWEKVHVTSLVPKEKAQLPEEPKNLGGRGMMGMGPGSSNMMMNMMRNQQMQQSQMGMMGMGSGMAGRMPMMGSGMGGFGGGDSLGNFWRSEEKKVMIRALDFTVEQGNSYRYRVRIVVANPNFAREDVNSGVDTKEQYLFGPWSKETDIVTMPPDVQPYAVAALPPSGQSDTKVRFEVVRFNRADGWTVPHRFEAGVGEVIGDPRRDDVPSSDGSGKKSETIDFSTRQIVLDLSGGGLQDLPAGLVGPSIERPALAMLLRSDGAMVVHSQADDVANEIRRDIYANYRHELEQSNKKREHSQGSGYAGMMGSMMGGRGRGGR